MKLTLHFNHPSIGLIKIETDSKTGRWHKLFVNGVDHSDNGEMETRVSQTLGHKALIFAMFDAQNCGGVFRQQTKSNKAAI